MRRLRDEQTQKRGIVLVVYHHNDPIAELNYVLQLKTLLSLSTALPQRLMGAHYCGNDPNLLHHIAQYQLDSSQHDRFRIRPHCATTWDEINAELRTYGIHAAFGPMLMPHINEPVQNGKENHIDNDDDGRTTLTLPSSPKQPSWSSVWHTHWLQRVKSKEEKEEKEESVRLTPERFDVLLGRTRRSLDHTGNRRLALICEMQYQQYVSTDSRNRKTEISNRIVSIVHDSGGRFLQWDAEEEDGCWVEVDDKVAQAKVAHTFRHHRSKLSKTKG